MSEAQKRSVQAQYTRQAGRYAQSRTHSQGETLEWMAARARGAKRALDVAAGAGFAAFALAPYVGGMVALDLTRAMLEQTRELAEPRGLLHLRLVEGDAEALPFASQSFDVVACRVAAHHFPSVPRFLAEARRVLAPGGRLLLVDTCSPEAPAVSAWQQRAERLRDPSHVRNLEVSVWQEELRRAGLLPQEVSTAYRVPLQFSDWVQRAGTSPLAVRQLEDLFAQAPPAVVQAFGIAGHGGDLIFHWPMIACLAIPV